MSFLIDFLSGRQNRAVRDLAFAGLAMSVLSVGLASVLANHSQTLERERQLASAVRAQQAGPRVTNEFRSVLDEPSMTGSIGGMNSVVIDPCTGKAKP
jgi:hypothetical protein